MMVSRAGTLPHQSKDGSLEVLFMATEVAEGHQSFRLAYHLEHVG